ncbi:MAG: AAA family ATPase [Acidimicrobiales bacterium]
MIKTKILVASRGRTLAAEVQAGLGAGYQVHSCTRVGDLFRYLFEHGPFDLLVAGPTMDNAAGMARLSRVRDQHPELGLVLVLPPQPTAGIRSIVRTGASDVVEYPCDPAQLHLAVRRALKYSQWADTAARSAREAALADIVATPVLGTVFTVASPSGGCGKTFYATNLAYQLARTTGQRVCLVDLDLQFGEVSTALRLKSRYTISDVLNQGGDGSADDEGEFGEVERALEDHIDEYLVAHDAGFWVLPAPREPAEADHISPAQVTKVIEALRQRFDYLIVDTPAQLSEIVLSAFDQSTRLICLATLDLPSVRNMVIFLNTLERLKISSDDISIILNKVESDVGININEVPDVFHHPLDSILPYAKEVSRSINQGLPVLATSPNSDLARRMVTGMAAYVPGAAGTNGSSSNGSTALAPAPSMGVRLFRRALALKS